MTDFVESQNIVIHAIINWNIAAYEAGVSGVHDEFAIIGISPTEVLIDSKSLLSEAYHSPVIRLTNNKHGKYAFSVYLYNIDILGYHDLCVPSIMEPTQSLRWTLSRARDWLLSNVL